MEAGARRAPPSAARGAESGQPAVPRAAGALWLAVYLPWLAGEVMDSDPARPLVVTVESPRGWLVYRASPGARSRGVCAGMTVSAAGVLCNGLGSRPRRRHAEQRRLAEIADRMLAFTPLVSIQPPETVLLEVRGSLSLFGGLERLRRRVGRQLEAAGHRYCLAGAPTPAAAECLVHGGLERVIEDTAALRSALGGLPVTLLGLEDETVRRLQRAGIATLRDLWRLPADSLARRFGKELTRRLERLRGRQPDPRPRHEPAPYFYASLTLDRATGDRTQLARAVEHLLREWTGSLRRCGRGTSGFTIECGFEGGRRPASVAVGVRQVSRDPDHLLRLAVERLSRARLDGPVAELALSSHRIHLLPGHSGELFETGQEAARQRQRSEELLAMHLGGRGLASLQAVAEHRPGLAWRRDAAAPAAAPAATGPARPLWLLDPPRPWWPGEAARGGKTPALIQGPERIETGWWDQRDQRRDYYVAVDRRGRRLWVFRDLRGGQWYLHGLFA